MKYSFGGMESDSYKSSAIKVLTVVLLVLHAQVFVYGQIFDEGAETYEVKYYDYFSVFDSEPREKEWSFELQLTQLDSNYYEACYSKELVDCLYLLNKFRKQNIVLGSGGFCFNYILDQNNEVVIVGKNDGDDYFKALKKWVKNNFRKESRKELKEEIKYFRKYDDTLEKELLREIKLIHEYDYCDIPMGVMGVVEDDEPIDYSDMKLDERRFVEMVRNSGIQRIDVFRNPEINDEAFLVDYMFVVDLFNSEKRADKEKILQDYFDGSLDIDDYDNITLNRDQRHLNKADKKLNYLLKQRRTVSDTMTKISKMEIIKVGR